MNLLTKNFYKMKKIKFIQFFSFLILFFLTCFANAETYTIGNYTLHHIGDNYYLIFGQDTTLVDKEVITVNFYDNVTATEKGNFETNYNLTYIRETIGGYINYKLPYNNDFITLCDSIYNDELVEEFEINYFFKLYGFIPNDEEINEQWYLEKIEVFGTGDAYGAWDLTTGSEDIIVAVLDAGLQWDHEDIGPVYDNFTNVFHNPGEDTWFYWTNPNSGDGEDGPDPYDYIDDWKGWDFYNNDISGGNNNTTEDNDVRPNTYSSISSIWHGTAVSSIIAAKTNNGLDIAGIAGGNIETGKGGVKILPIKLFDYTYDDDGSIFVGVSSVNIPIAIEYATNMGAKVINLSFGIHVSYNLSQSINAAIDNAYNNNIVIVAASGIDRHPNYDYVSYPARYEKVIAVGATNQDDDHANWSQIGPELEIAAPGVDIITLDNEYCTPNCWGNSYSTAMVSATVALMFSVNPYLTNTDVSVRDILHATADKVGSYNYNNGWNKYLGYGRLNTYKAVCMALDLLPPISIQNNDETWYEPVFSKNDIIIEPGRKLTIHSTVYMSPGKKIIVKPTAQLIVDGGKLTNFPFCGEENDKWEGVEVWGDSDQHQFTFNDQCAQGKLILKDSAIIENAVFAITLWQPENWNTTGGIVQATDAFFYNNSRSAQFMEYHNIFNGNEYDNQSYFNNCTFEINNNFITDGNWYAAQIYMWAVKGIKIKGCTYTNLRDTEPTACAIFTNNSGYTVKGVCTSQIQPCPDNDFKRTTFNNFYKAIDASNSPNVLYPISIRESDFTNNVLGICFKCVNLSTILNNNLSIGYSDVCGYNYGLGIQMINSKGFAIEDNNFMEPTSNPDLFSFGLLIVNTNNDYDEVYGNTFNGLFSANYAIEKNWGSSRFKGLTYYCNQNQYNNWDFYVGYGNDRYSGIQIMQGSPTYVTGNTFSTDAIGHFYNDGSHGVGYYYNMNEPAEVPDVNKVFQVTREPVDLVNTCPPHYGGGNILLSTSDKQQRELDFNQAKRNYNIANVQYELLDPVNDSTERKLLEIQMSEFNTQMARAAYDIIRSELSDTLVHYAEVKTWLYNLETYSADEMLIELYMQQGEYSAALALLDSLPQLYSLSVYDSIEYAYYKTLKTMQSSWMGEGRNIFGLNADEITQLASLADSSRGTAGTQAKGILEFAHGYNYQDCPQVAGFGFKSSPAEQKNGEKESDLCISVQPNPAGTLTVFKYTLPEDCAEALLSISDVAGRTISTIQCNQAHGRIEWNTNGIETGLYFYTLSANGYSKSGKIVINK
jgi:hypothetical protein